jgi:probable rRNA maturation factor
MIAVTNLQRSVPIPQSKVRRLARQILGDRNLSIAFVTDRAIRKLNRAHLKHDFATDVLAFPLGTDLLGEVVISAPCARRQARLRSISVEEELLRYVAHGILHLLGYDDHRPKDRRRMWSRQEREVRRILAGPLRRRSPAPRAGRGGRLERP